MGPHSPRIFSENVGGLTVMCLDWPNIFVMVPTKVKPETANDLEELLKKKQDQGHDVHTKIPKKYGVPPETYPWDESFLDKKEGMEHNVDNNTCKGLEHLLNHAVL